MYFKQIDEIVDGTKTQTRRVCKPGEELTFETWINPHGVSSKTKGGSWLRDTVRDSNGRLKWQIGADWQELLGKDYAVSPGRGKCGVWWNTLMSGATEWQQTRPGEFNSWQPLRIRLLEIRREPLQAITDADALAEGWPADEDVRECGHCDALYPTGFYDGPDIPCICNPVVWYRCLWNAINTRKGIRWDDNPDVWALRFEVVR